VIEFAPEPGGRETLAAFLQSLSLADWESATGPIRLSADLTLADLAEAAFFRNTRLLLAALAAKEGTAATATDNLNRVFVRELFDQLTLPEPYRIMAQRARKVINERDVWPLHLVRVVSQCAGFVVLRKQRFHLTRTGRALLPEGQAGALFRRLFLAYFRKFDLHYDFHLRDVPGIQSTMAAILWRLDTVARDWRPVRGLAPQIVLPAVLRQLVAAKRSAYDTEEWILAGYVLEPLIDLGLIQQRPDTGWMTERERREIQVSALWRKFISFHPGPGDAR
jgi:hypothetical protein